MDALISFFSKNMAFGLVGLVVLLVGIAWVIYRSHQNYRQDIGDFEQEDFPYFDLEDPLDNSAQKEKDDLDNLTKRAEAVFGQQDEIPELDDPILTPNAPEPQPELTPQTSTQPQQLIISLAVHSIQAQGFSNQDVVNSLQQLGLQFGKMQIFHHYGLDMNPDNPAVFSVANMVEPGDFSNLNEPSFFSPGLVLFMQLPNPLSGRVAFELMFNHAQRLTALLQAQLECDRHQRLDAARIDEIREQIDMFELKNST